MMPSVFLSELSLLLIMKIKWWEYWIEFNFIYISKNWKKHFTFFPGVHFDTSSTSLVNEITTAIKVYAYGVEDFTNDYPNRSLNTQLSCEGVGASRWDTGDKFFRYLRNVSVEADQGKPNLEFTQDGVLKAAELKIMNLRPGVSRQLVWEEVSSCIHQNDLLLEMTNTSFQLELWGLVSKHI